jgi:hypothetical protein
LSLDLARQDPEAFKLLFLPDAITIVRPRGKGAIKVTSPILYLNEAGRPQSSYRKASGEYSIEYRSDPPALQRALEFLDHYTRQFPLGGSFVHFSRAGQCCIIRNEVVGHARTRFIDGSAISHKRRLSRKWFMRRAKDAQYKHVPGILVLDSYAKLFPKQFGPDALVGEWLYNPELDRNIQKPIDAL